MPYPEEEYDKEFFSALLKRFEKIWANCFQGAGISKSAAFTAFIQIDQIGALCRFFEDAEEIDKDDEWKTN